MKHKSCLCSHGGIQQWGVSYWEICAPVVNCISGRTLLVVAKIHGLSSQSIDFVLAFPQEYLNKVNMFMQLPIGTEVEGEYGYVLKLNKFIYGLKQSSLNWFEHLRKGLEERDYVQSWVYPYIFLRDNSIVLCYVDDFIILEKENNIIDELVTSLRNGTGKYDLTVEGTIEKYLGVQIVTN